ncbi:hypothetical protein [Corynebacterium sp.]|uniref:hypothetical protein n=1 Tax=Corynebacterium sp. TaxID=1720 RepID=UPI0026DF1610|nr:hypothetical protein [Corynebacterium sp.]MDO5511176.1 hypothetical protein [Corynebacterium sp.]
MRRTLITVATAALALGLAPAAHAQSSIDHRQEGTVWAPRLTEVTRHEVLPGNQVRVHYVTGDPACYGAHAVAVETPWAVHVRVVTGPRVGGADVCTMIALEESQVLQLSAPLGGRSLHV